MKKLLSAAIVVASVTLGGLASADDTVPPPPAPAPSPPAPEAAPASAVGGETAAPEPQVDYGGKEPGDGQRLVGGVVGATGFIGGAIGLFLVISSTTLYDEAKSRCKGHALCQAGDVDDANKARSRANGGGWVMIAGGAVLAGGIALYFTAPHAKKSVAIAPGLGNLSLQGTF